ncbi:hypothetical protein L1887_62806 [Cichorium endivia]|nr:hypothetical protein L1887_62806 [Cichorium endivia]
MLPCVCCGDGLMAPWAPARCPPAYVSPPSSTFIICTTQRACARRDARSPGPYLRASAHSPHIITQPSALRLPPSLAPTAPRRLSRPRLGRPPATQRPSALCPPHALKRAAGVRVLLQLPSASRIGVHFPPIDSPPAYPPRSHLSLHLRVLPVEPSSHSPAPPQPRGSQHLSTLIPPIPKIDRLSTFFETSLGVDHSTRLLRVAQRPLFGPPPPLPSDSLATRLSPQWQWPLIPASNLSSPHPMGYDTMRYAPPQFTNPWVSGPTTQSHPYATSLPPAPAGEYKAPAPSVSAAYPSGQVSAPTLPTGIIPMDPALLDQSGLQLAQDGMGAPRPYGASYTTTAAPNGAMYAPVSQPQPQYSAEVLQRGSPYNNYDRRSSHPSVASTMFVGDPVEVQRQRQSSLIDFNDRLHSASEAERQSFSDALDASRGMVAMAQSDITPRNIYGQQNNNRASSDSYGFPSAHSAHSSISSASTYGNYYNSSVSEASVGDYRLRERVCRYAQLPHPPSSLRPNRWQSASCASVDDGPVQLEGLVQQSEEAQVQDLRQAFHPPQFAPDAHVQPHRREAYVLTSLTHFVCTSH